MRQSRDNRRGQTSSAPTGPSNRRSICSVVSLEILTPLLDPIKGSSKLLRGFTKSSENRTTHHLDQSVDLL
ncbi:hypothetical protein ATANTOWER_032160 [Ataeniobius toweri]|uniref:Uncharacterized protein n=1 Tax=Ataeniobius toweri TaxID=208326 RepID=A0ABU7BC20_9TELE|nr:hypothetical protein [Ataeniobius toweri]